MNLGRLLGAAVKVVVRSPGVSFGSAFIVGAPAALALTLAQLTMQNVTLDGPTVLVVLAATLLIWASASALLSGILVTPVERWLAGQRAGFNESWRRGLQRLGPLAGYTLVVTGAIVAAFLLLNTPAVALAGPDWRWYLLLLLTLPLTLVPAAWIYVVTVLGIPAIMVERVGVAGSLRRSRELLRATFWPTLGTVLLVLLLTWLAQVVISLPFGLVTGTALAFTDDMTVTTLANSVGVIAQTTLTFPFLSAVITLLYFDRRARQAAGQAGG